jgi:hypothetical protein
MRIGACGEQHQWLSHLKNGPGPNLSARNKAKNTPPLSLKAFLHYRRHTPRKYQMENAWWRRDFLSQVYKASGSTIFSDHA